MNQIKEQGLFKIENSKLMKEWKNQPHHKGKLFITDGIIDYNLWTESKRKVLFLLKEVNSGTDKNGWDMCKVIKDDWRGPKYKMWWTTAYWAYGLQRVKSNFIPQFPNNKIDPDWLYVSNALLSSAIVNVKKSNGQSTSSIKNLSEYVKNDGELIKRQINLINPNIILCGGTWDLIKHIFPTHEIIADMVYKINDTMFIDYWHPANRWPNKLNYYTLCAIVSKLLDDNTSIE